MIPSYLTHCIQHALANRRPLAPLEFFEAALRNLS